MAFLTSDMLQMALQSENGLEKLKELREMERSYNAEQAEKSYRVAMSKLQGVMPVIKKLKWNEFSKSAYASLDDIVLQVQPFLEQFGFSYEWKQTEQNGTIIVKTIAHHIDGHSEESELQAMADTTGAQGKANKTPVQGAGSTVTYLRRYTFCGVFGIATADHDIDGRIEGVTERQKTKSITLNQLMADNKMPIIGSETAKKVEQMIFNSNSSKALEEAAELINSVANADEREHLYKLYQDGKNA